MSTLSRYGQRSSRRRFLQVAGVTGFTVAASGRGGYAVAQTPTAIGSYQQAPTLDVLDLPPVAERLPLNPMVVEPIESIGRYGGLWRTGMVGGADAAWLEKLSATTTSCAGRRNGTRSFPMSPSRSSSVTTP